HRRYSLLLRWKRRRRARLSESGKASLNLCAGLSERGATLGQLFRALGDSETHRACNSVLLERRHISVLCSRLHEAVFVRSMAHSLATAEARHVAEHLWMLRGVSVECLDDLGRTR